VGIILFLLVLMMILGKVWRFYVESAESIERVHALEPWYWFVFLNLSLCLITSNYDEGFMLVGLLIQLTLSVWFAISVVWIIKSCEHKNISEHESWFVKGRIVKFCYRCGTRLPDDFEGHPIKDYSWQNIYFQIPPHLFDFIGFWLAQSMMVLISLFLVLRYLKRPGPQHEAVLIAIILVVLAPPLVYYFGRFRSYLSETKGLIWWEDLKSSFVIWIVLIALLLWLLHSL
jgi:hypothetical protein